MIDNRVVDVIHAVGRETNGASLSEAGGKSGASGSEDGSSGAAANDTELSLTRP
jgi:hypothetical protein